MDYSLKKALEFAEFEASLGVRSTYYILVNGFYFNPTCYENMEKIRMINDLGHNVGLHFDLKPYKDLDVETQALCIAAHRAFLEYTVRDEIKYITFHKTHETSPSYELITELSNHELFYPNMNNGYKYITDDNCQWSEDPIEAIRNYPNIHLSTHPIWWGEKDDVWESRIHDLRLDEMLERQIIKDLNHTRLLRTEQDL